MNTIKKYNPVDQAGDKLSSKVTNEIFSRVESDEVPTSDNCTVEKNHTPEFSHTVLIRFGYRKRLVVEEESLQGNYKRREIKEKELGFFFGRSRRKIR